MSLHRRARALAAVAGLVAAIAAPGQSFAQAPLEINYTSQIGGAVYPAPVANGYPNNDQRPGTIYGFGAFVADGDLFRVSDMEQDDMRVAVHWRLGDGSRRGLCVNKDGFWNRNGQCNKDLPEGKNLFIRVGRCDGDTAGCEVIGDFRAQDWTDWYKTSTS